MKTNTFLMSALVLAAVAVSGCEKKEESKPVTPSTPSVKTTTEDAKAKVEAGAEKAKTETATKTEDAAAKTESTAAKTEEAVKTEAASATDAAKTDATAAADGAKTAATDATAKAKSLLEKVIQLIKDKKWDEASTNLKELDSLKASVPESLQKQIADAHTSFDAAKAADGLKGLIK